METENVDMKEDTAPATFEWEAEGAVDDWLASKNVSKNESQVGIL